METKRLKFQKSAQAGAVALNGNEEEKMSNTSKAAAAVAGLTAGAAAGYAGYEAYQHYQGTDATEEAEVVAAEAADTDAVHDAIANLTADAPAVDLTPIVEAEAAPVEHHSTPVEQTVVENPDEVSDAILAGDFIDPVDAQTDDFPYEVGEIAQVYNVNGELEMSTEIEIDGSNMVLVDVNNDGIFDVVRDEYGNEAELGVVSSVSDMEMLYAQQHGDNGYLASNDVVNDDNSFADDIIDPSALG